MLRRLRSAPLVSLSLLVVGPACSSTTVSKDHDDPAGGTAGAETTGGTGSTEATGGVGPATGGAGPATGGSSGAAAGGTGGGSACPDPSCTEGDVRCAEATASPEVCEADAEGCPAWVPGTPCSGATPVCEAGECTVCTEHAQCPNSACHLAGPNQGTCFAAESVVSVGSAAELEAALAGLAATGELALLLAPGTYEPSGQTTISAGQEVALIGAPGTTWTGNGTWGDARNSWIQVQGSALAYFSHIALVETEPLSTGLEASSGSMLWLDDVRIDGYVTALRSGATETHIRRSFLRGASSQSISMLAGALFMESSVAAPPPTDATTQTAALTTGPSASVVLDVRYSTLAGGDDAVYCNAVPQPSGAIRNSILLDHDTSGSPLSEGCSTLTLSGNYAPGIYFTAGWFVDTLAGDFHLSAAGRTAVSQTAVWGEGDPSVDLDGDPRPLDGYPGADEP